MLKVAVSSGGASALLTPNRRGQLWGAQLVGRRPVVPGAARITALRYHRTVIRVHHLQEVAADQVGRVVAVARHGVIDEDDAIVGIQLEDDVRHAVDDGP
jgi:hypothetical protein